MASATTVTSSRRMVRASLSASLGWAEQTLASTLPNPVRCMALDRASRAFDAAVTLWRELEASGSLFAALRGAGVELSTISWSTVPVAAGWFILALVLGRAQERRSRQAAG